MQCLCRVFMKYSCQEDLDTLLLRVTQELKAYCTTKGEKQINETLLRGVTRKLFFNPGLNLGHHSHHSLATSNEYAPAFSGQNHYLTQPQSFSVSQREATLEMTGMNPRVLSSHLDEVWSGIGTEMGPCAV